MNHASTPVPPGDEPSSSPILPPDAQARLVAFLDACPSFEPDAIDRQTERICSENASFRSRYRKLIELANQLNAALAPYATCRKGCHYCCAMATLVYRFEAVALAEASGRKMRELPFRPWASVLATTGAAPVRMCPFVVDGNCSVYDARPMICRLHHSLNASPTDCQMTEQRLPRAGIAMYNPDLVEIPYHNLVRAQFPREPWGAITEFFPPGEGGT